MNGGNVQYKIGRNVSNQKDYERRYGYVFASFNSLLIVNLPAKLHKKIDKKFWLLKKSRIFAVDFAEVAQLVEHNLAKVRVAGSSPVFRSRHDDCRLEWWNR